MHKAIKNKNKFSWFCIKAIRIEIRELVIIPVENKMPNRLWSLLTFLIIALLIPIMNPKPQRKHEYKWRF